MVNEIRPIGPEEFEAFVATQSMAFGFDPNAEVREQEKRIYEFDRSLAVFDGSEIAGTTGIYSFVMTVPGGALPTAGVTSVAVRPTHRRRGVLNQMMRRQLDDVRERGEALAALWASESVIYGRFGYGLAAEGAELEIERTRSAFAHEAPDCGRLRIVSRDDALATWPAIWDRVLPQFPGMYSRGRTWWEDHSLRVIDPFRARATKDVFVTYEEEEPLGYVRYRFRSENQNGMSNSTVLVEDLIAVNDNAYGALWRYVFSIDLVGKINASLRRVDEPLFFMLADPRRLLRRVHDTLWVRLVDVPAALEARRYPAEGRVVLDVRDAFCPWNEGLYQLEGGPDGARCTKTDAEPDVTLSAADLGAAYLGGTRLRTLAAAGRVQGDPDAVARADALFGWELRPWCPEIF